MEVVTRIAALTDAPKETLGPGSKERKSVLVNLADRLGLNVDFKASKPDLGAQIAEALGVEWDYTCWSAGHTLTLVGLNNILFGAERRVAEEAETD